MAQLIGPNLLAQGLPLISQKSCSSPSKQEWNFSSREYHDITPPSEISEGEELSSVSSGESIINYDPDVLAAVIGVGYVGEHLVGAFSKNYNVLGYDVSEARTQQLERSFGGVGNVQFTHRATDLAEATHFLISVPTLLKSDKKIDSSFLESALSAVGQHAKRGSVVVIESSVAVGMTRALLGPLAEAKGFFAGMSPERVDPGRVDPPAHAIPKIISGLDDIAPGSLDAIHRLYSKSFGHIVPVSQPEVAEMMKLYENCQRMVCIAYANEMADACLKHEIDPYEVCRAASTKPFGYLPFSPGLGVGGHCIPVNPYYLLSNSEFPLLQAASEKMRERPQAIAQRAVNILYKQPRSIDSLLQPRVLVAGIGFKRGQSHLANSPGLELVKSLALTGKLNVSWVDPLVTQAAVPEISRLDVDDWNVESLQQNFDMIIVAFRQDGLDFGVLESLQGVYVEMWCP